MRRFLFYIIFCLGAFVPNAYAYEYSKLNSLYSLLESKYDEHFDFRKISISGISSLNYYDKNFSIHHSDSKAFLYYKNNLIKTFNLPKENESHIWKNVLTEILDIYSDIKNNVNQTEQYVVSQIVKNIDTFSRIEVSSYKNEKLEYKIEDNIAYIKSSAFYSGYTDEVKEIIQNNTNLNGIIFDFRNNRGGDFNEAISLSDLFLDNALITYSSDGKKTQYYTSSKGDIFNGKKIVILVNNKTASAAELVVASLGEQSRAIIVGTKTYGKGSIQSIYNLDNYNLYITSGIIYSPSGKKFDKIGITPQICTGIHDSCIISDKNNLKKDIITAINLIKNKLG